MKTHEYSAPLNGRKGQRRRGSEQIMQVHENLCIKRAGVAGLRSRTLSLQGDVAILLFEKTHHELISLMI
ncbi:hypothetical protein L2D04_07415 [Pantoea agglomerans]|jgi:hypothetical protein|uniref:hypothetical protein n=1 Tax=Enterobacter agglomerans TaxID=549 RepID=UPI001F172792|nr:hypothetical protein [Pantoea agglomerans]UJQ24896.1 hypothetical protein L2D04_07415 [Pantoea agglomerans]